MVTDRYGGAYGVGRDDFANNFLVKCPRCGRQAFVCRRPEDPGARLTCSHCGHNQRKGVRKRYFIVNGLRVGSLREDSVMIFAGPYDPYFLAELWLVAPFGEHYFWAYNEAHLEVLERHVAARLRDRSNLPNRNGSLGSRLPGWMTLAQHRKAILQLIARLRVTI